MKKDQDKTLPFGAPKQGSSVEEEYGYSTTVEISRTGFSGDIPTREHALLEIIGLDQRREIIELGEKEVVIGRSPECGIQLPIENVSRIHARVTFRGEEYHVEDLDSTNGVYVNGIRIVKCILRDHDVIEIGGVKMLFSEARTLKKP
jgi:hypothetical protein